MRGALGVQRWGNLLQTQGKARPGSNSSCPSVPQVGGFAWEDCGDGKDPVVLKSLSVVPDPISIPGSLRVSAAVSSSKAMASPLKVSAGDASMGRGRAELPRTAASWEMPSSGYGNEQPLGEQGAERCRAERTGLCKPEWCDGHGDTRSGS